MPTTISNPDFTKHFTVKDVRAYFAGEGIDVVGKAISLRTDELGMVSEMIVDVILTAPQIAAFELEFFPKNLTPLTTKGDVLTHNVNNEVRLPVGLDGKYLKALASAPEGIVWGEGGFELIADETLGVAGAIFDVAFPAREFLFIIIYLEEGGGSDLNAHFFFNDDGDAGNFAYRREENFGGTVTTFTNEDFVQLDSGTPNENVNSTLLVFNLPAVEHSFMQRSVSEDGTSPFILPLTQKAEGTWHDTPQVIKLNVRSPGDVMTTNSRIIVFGSKT